MTFVKLFGTKFMDARRWNCAQWYYAIGSLSTKQSTLDRQRTAMLQYGCLTSLLKIYLRDQAASQRTERVRISPLAVVSNKWIGLSLCSKIQTILWFILRQSGVLICVSRKGFKTQDRIYIITFMQ